MTSLDDEIAKHRAEVRTNQWSVSIGELFSLYERGQLEINPAFQRFFRWSDVQKTYLVESLLLGLPVPPLFLAQSEEGVLEVVDGVQRISTLLQLRGILRAPVPADDDEGETDRDGKRDDGIVLRPPLVMTAGQYLSGLDGLVWDDRAAELADQGAVKGTLSDAQRSDVLFSKLDATIIHRTSTGQAKYDVFRRLNSYGEPLTPQEMRAAMIASVNGDCLRWLSHLARSGDTPELLSLSDRQLQQQYDVELVLRFFFLAETERLIFSELRDFPRVLDDYGIRLANDYPSDRTSRLDTAFQATLTRISSAAGSDFFRRFVPDEGRFRGPFLNTSFEALASAIGYRLLRDLDVAPDLLGKVRDFWSLPQLAGGFATGKSTESRIVAYVPLGRELLAP